MAGYYGRLPTATDGAQILAGADDSSEQEDTETPWEVMEDMRA